MRNAYSLRWARRRVLPAVPLVIALAVAGIAGGAVASASPVRPAGSGAHPRGAARLALTGGTLPAAVVGEPYSYQFLVGGGGTAAWYPIAPLPLGLTLDRDTGVLSGIPEEAGDQQLVVSAARGGAHPALGSERISLTVRPAANGAASIWGSRSRPSVAGSMRVSASTRVSAGTVASSLYQALYFQAVDNPKALQPDLVNVLLADVAAQVYAGNSKRQPGHGEQGLAALRSAFEKARNAQAPASAGKGLPSFGPTLVPQLTGAIGVMAAFAKSPGAGIIGPAVQSVGTSIYGAYLKTSIATGIGFSTGYAGFSDRSLYNAGDLNASGFHALVSGPAIQRAVACGQANAACATVENSLLTPVVRTGLDRKPASRWPAPRPSRRRSTRR